MALIVCSECGKEISDKAAACVHCGCPLQTTSISSNLQEINGVPVDMKELLDFFGEDVIGAAMELSRQTGISGRDARKLVDAQRTQFSNPQDNAARCPRCGSSSLSGDKKGFGIGKAVVGAALLGPIGLVAGNAGAKKVRITCMSCGYQDWAGR